jgi:hypothetical protein
MTQGVKMKKTREYPMALLVPVKGKTLINLVEVALAGDEITNQMMATTIIVRKGSLILGKDDLVASVIGRTGVKEEGVLVDQEMKNVGVVEVVVVEGVGEEGALVVDEGEGNLTDTVEVIKRKCCSNVK